MEAAQAGRTDGKDSLKLMRQQLQDDVLFLKDTRQQVQERIESRRLHQRHIISSLQSIVPSLVSSLDISLQLISSFNGRPYAPNPNPNPINSLDDDGPSFTHRSEPKPQSLSSKPSSADPTLQPRRSDGDKKALDDDGAEADPLSVIRSLVAVCLLERVPFTAVDSTAVLRKLEADPSATPADKAALLELGGEAGPISAVETALRAIADGSGGVDLEDFGVSGKNRIMVLGIDRSRLMKELPESSQQPPEGGSIVGNVSHAQVPSAAGMDANGGILGMGGAMPRQSQEMWIGAADPHMPGLPPIFPGAGTPAQMMGPRGGPRLMVPRMMGVPPLHRPPLGPAAPMVGPNSAALKASSEEDDMKDVEALLNKKTFREMQQSKTGEELHDLIHRPTAKETAVAAKVHSCFTFEILDFYSA